MFNDYWLDEDGEGGIGHRPDSRDDDRRGRGSRRGGARGQGRGADTGRDNNMRGAYNRRGGGLDSGVVNPARGRMDAERGRDRGRGRGRYGAEGGGRRDGSHDRRDENPARGRMDAERGRGLRGRGRGGGGRGIYRGGGRGGPFHQRANDRQRDQEDGHVRGRGQRGGFGDQRTDRRGGYRGQENARCQTQDKYGRKPGNFRPLSSRLLIEILKKDPSEAATELGSLKGNLQAGLNEDSIDEGRQHLFWKALAFICGALGADQTVIMLLTMAIDSKLFKHHLLSFLTKLRRPGEEISERRRKYLKNVITVFSSAMQSLPSRSTDLQVAVTLITDSVSEMDEYGEQEELMESLKSLTTHMEEIEKERASKRQRDRIAKNPPPDDFRKQDILPTVKELQAGYQPFLRPHLTRGVYADTDHYLDVQFRLLKEDFIYPLRNGIAEYLAFKKANPERRAKLQDVRIYEDAQYSRSDRDFSGISHYMSFKKLPRVRWTSSKRLMYGSLLILSTDDFKSYIFATVAKRDVKDLEQGLVAISLVDQEDASCLLHKKYVMAESSVFFEAYRPVLLGLQRMSGLPFSRYTLSMLHDVRAPSYLIEQPNSIENDGPFCNLGRVSTTELLDISPLLKRPRSRHSMIDVLDESAWPDIDDVQLDYSQYDAVKTALTKELSIVQGPPGTGKTYIGLKIVETLLLNRDVWSSEEQPSQILLVCYTNHALDQFLEGILEFLPTGIVRVGSRSKSESLQAFNLNRLVGRRGYQDQETRQEYVQRRVRHVKKEVDAAKRRVERTQARIVGARNGIINEYELGQFMTWQHYNSLFRLWHMKQLNSWLVEWLLCERQYDRDWNQQDTPQQSEDTKQNEKEEDSDPDLETNFNATIDVDHERSAIESERMIDDDFDEEDSDEEDDEDYPFLGLDLNQIDRKQHGTLRRYIQRKMSGNDVLDPRVLQSITDVWSMHPNDRWALYHTWLKSYLVQLNEKLPAYELKFKQLCGQLDEAKDVEKYHVLRQATVIGMTTTGAANNQQVLQRVRPKIVVVEEAAEVLEAHIITSLNASCEQLILIGDHQQLRPKPNVYLLAKKYHLDVSMFERLINNDFPYSQLVLQHRMRIELSGLMRRHFYDSLLDHESVRRYTSVKAVTKDIFFLNHSEPENETEDTQSHYNLHEANLIVALCYYLLQQGYQSDKITILTAYTGQLLKIKHMMDRDKFEGVKVTSIDNYQGEENDIILLSFVRSNNHGHIGFLGISNRVCVSLSRAKIGLYCIGNFTLFAEKSELWKGIVKDLQSTESVGESLTLQCTNHHEKTAVRAADDFKKVPLGGCSRDCDTRLDCGHVCRLKCHPTDLTHVIYQCKARCPYVICDSNHQCPNLCSEECPEECSVMVEKVLPCGHTCKAECKTDIWSIKCEKKVIKTLSCSHVRILPCHLKTEGLEKECESIVIKELQCGHFKTEECNGSGRCDEEILKILECQHICIDLCHKDIRDIRCEKLVEKYLPCGHQHTLPCHTDVDNVQCNTITLKVLSCGHHIIEKCCHKSKCPEMVEKTLPKCGHKLEMRCSTDVETVKCKARCSKELKCGHICKKMCEEDCTSFCKEKVTREDWPCGHKVIVRCLDKRDACYIPCEDILICGHGCKGTCGKCLRGRYHVPCGEPCQKRLICGHTCGLKCGVPCLGCKQKCLRRCRHSQCKHPCSEPCEPCMKRCNWKCDHHECKKLCCEPCDRPPCNEPCPKKRKCEHSCIGLCGEICPNKCRICDKEELEQRFFGTEDIQTARYIQLEDCGHYFEVDGLDKFLGFDTKPDSASAKTFTKISVKSCPKCNKPIQLSRRYGNLLKQTSLIKPQIIKKLREVGNNNEDKQLIMEVNTAVKSATSTLQRRSLSNESSDYTVDSHLSRLSRMLGMRSTASTNISTNPQESKNRPLLDNLQELIKASTENLERNNASHVLTDQRAFDLWTEMNSVRIMCSLFRLLNKNVSETTGVPRLLAILGQDSNLSFTELKSAYGLLNQIHTANKSRLTDVSSITTFKRRPRLTYDQTMWLTCAKGHPVAQHHLKTGACEDCVREKREEERARSEAAAFKGHQGNPGQHFDRGQQGQRGRGRGRGRRGRGRRGGRRNYRN